MTGYDFAYLGPCLRNGEQRPGICNLKVSQLHLFKPCYCFLQALAIHRASKASTTMS